MFSHMLLQASVNTASFMHQFFLIGGVVIIFYFFMVRPQKKRQREQKNFFATIDKGVQVVTVGGIHGKIHEVTADTLTLEVDKKGTKITIARDAISLEMSKKYFKKD